MERNGTECNGMERNGMEWNGMPQNCDVIIVHVLRMIVLKYKEKLPDLKWQCTSDRQNNKKMRSHGKLNGTVMNKRMPLQFYF